MSATKTWRQTLKFYFKLTAAVSFSSYGILHIYWKNLRKQINDEEILKLKKDTTRPTNEYYGINWGYRADNTIEKSFNTGDIVLFDYKCNKWLYPKDLVKWYLKKMNNKDEFSNVGFTFKTPVMLFVVFSHFGKLQIMPYNEFLNRPYISRIKGRNFENPPVDISKKSIDFINLARDISNVNREQDKVERHSNKGIEKMKDIILKKNIDSIASLYFNQLGVLRVNPLKQTIKAKDFDWEHPHIFYKDYSLGPGYIIRSELTKDLKDNMNFK
jgi:hypothetical protein